MAISLDARYENFSVGDAPLQAALTGLTEFSISLWAKYDGGDRDSDFCTWGPHSVTPGGWLFWRDETDSMFGRSNTMAGLVGNNLRGVCATNSWNDTDWHHACLTVQAGSATGFHLYIDGVDQVDAQASLAAYTGLGSPGVEVRFGDSVPNSSGSWMIGDLDDCRIYNRILTPNEVMSIFTRRGMDDIFNGMLVRFPLQDKAPGQAMDATSNAVKDVGPYKYDGTANDTGYPTYIESAVLNGMRRRSA